MNADMRLRNEVLALLQKHIPRKQAEELLEKPPEGIGSDLALPCFSLAGKLQKNPAEIARELAEKIKPAGNIADVKATGPYLNFYFRWGGVAGGILAEAIKKDYGRTAKGRSRLMVEYAQPNPFKGFHIGHVRNIALGESLCRVLEFSGHRVVRANFQGDIGPHVAKALWGFIHIHRQRAPKGVDKGIWLGEVYSEASKRAKEDEKVAGEVEEINKRLYAGEKRIVGIWKKTRQWSLDYFDRVYDDFGARFDRLYMESEVEKPGIRVAKELLRKGVAKMSEGAIAVDLEKHGLGVFLILKSDGLALYSTKDLALARMQDREYHPDRIIHVVGSEQKLHFKQLIKTLELFDRKLAEKEYHLSYELVNLPTGKMKSREGKVILYDDLKERLVEIARRETRTRNPKLPRAELERISESIALGALKYGMISQSPEKVIVFDWDRAMDLQGNSGPYIQYAYARASSILKKAGRTFPKVFDASVLGSEYEINLIRTIMEFPEELGKAARDCRPHYLANYAHRLATQFNEFYQRVPVISAPDERARQALIALVFAFRNTLKNALYLLGIEALEKM